MPWYGRPFKNEESKIKIGRANSIALKGRALPQEVRDKIGDAHRGKPRPPEVVSKVAAKLRLRKGPLTSMFGKHHSEETKAKMCVALKGRHPSEEEKAKARAAHGTGMLGKHHSERTKVKIGSANKIALKGHHPSNETRIKNSIAAKALWQDPEWVVRHANAQNIKPNRAELRLQAILDKYFPGEWKFVGDGQLIIGGKIPDFVNVNGKKQLIELFGAHWHSLFDVAERREHFRQYGFQTAIVGEDELKDEERLAKTLKKKF